MPNTINNRPIKAHLNEEMREHLEFMTRRYLAELVTRVQAKPGRPGVNALLDKEIDITRKCLKELEQAGT